MKPETYGALTEAERQELRTVGARWPEWALKHIGADGDYWEALELRQDSGEWVIVYRSKPTPFRTKSRSVGAALIETAQVNLSKL